MAAPLARALSAVRCHVATTITRGGAPRLAPRALAAAAAAPSSWLAAPAGHTTAQWRGVATATATEGAVGPSTAVPLAGLLSMQGKSAVVTGGAKGIGRGIVARMHEAGARVAIVDFDAEAAREAAAAYPDGRVVAIQCDVGDAGACTAALAAAKEQLGGRLDVLVNDAGIFPFGAAMEMELETFDRVIATNVKGVFVMSREFVKLCAGAGSAIVNIGSIDSLHPSSVGLAAYDTSKGAVRMFNKAFALEVARAGIRVNMVMPGGITTEGTEALLAGYDPKVVADMMAHHVEKTPYGRMGVPDEIGCVALFLATPGSSYMTGAEVVVDGGTLLG